MRPAHHNICNRKRQRNLTPRVDNHVYFSATRQESSMVRIKKLLCRVLAIMSAGM
jgi:hypothetical protein